MSEGWRIVSVLSVGTCSVLHVIELTLRVPLVSDLLAASVELLTS